jgi:hypothetical protein
MMQRMLLTQCRRQVYVSWTNHPREINRRILVITSKSTYLLYEVKKGMIMGQYSIAIYAGRGASLQSEERQ